MVRGSGSGNENDSQLQAGRWQIGYNLLQVSTERDGTNVAGRDRTKAKAQITDGRLKEIQI